MDPEGRTPYVFEATGVDSFRLCAVFALDSAEEGQRSSWLPISHWAHGAGRQCFDLNIRHGTGDGRD